MPRNQASKNVVSQLLPLGSVYTFGRGGMWGRASRCAAIAGGVVAILSPGGGEGTAAGGTEMVAPQFGHGNWTPRYDSLQSRCCWQFGQEILNSVMTIDSIWSPG